MLYQAARLLVFSFAFPLVFLLETGGCGSPPRPAAAASVVATSVDDGATLTPTSTILVRLSASPDSESLGDGIVVVVGVPDAALLKQLEHPPVTDDNRERLAPVRVTALAGEAEVRVVPLRPYAPDTLHTLVVTTLLHAGGTRVGRGIEQAFLTTGAATGAAALALVEPLNGAVSVVRNLRRIEVAFSRPVYFANAGSLVLVDDADRVAPAAVTTGSLAGHYFLALERALSAGAHYRLMARSSIRGSDGESVFEAESPPGFSSGGELRGAAPKIVVVTLAASSGCLVADFTTSPPASAVLCVDGPDGHGGHDGHCVEETGLLASHELSLPLAAGAVPAVLIRARDESTAPEAVSMTAQAPASSSRALVITEVLARPRGAHYPQQFVEIQNQGTTPVAVGGLELHCDLGFDVLPDATLAPGAFALVVPADFEEDDGDDVPVRAGTSILRLERSRLGRYGIRENGASLSLTEAGDVGGAPVSRFSTDGMKLVAGQSASRVGRCDVAASYAPTAAGSATPGAP